MNKRIEAAKERLTKAKEGKLIPCPIWGSPYEARCIPNFFSDIHDYYSPRAGGVFRAKEIEDYHYFASQKATRIKISRWVYDKNRLGKIGCLTSDEIERIEKQEHLSIDQRMERLLRCFATIPSQVSRGLPCNTGGDLYRHERDIIEAATECSTVAGQEELDRLMPALTNISISLDWLISAADKSGWLEIHNSYRRLTPAGVKRLEELGTKAVNSEQAFVAMWFDESVDEAYEKGVEPAIRDAGYRPLRIDKKEHNNKIDDEIIREIRRSRFVVCDFTCELVKHKGKLTALPRGGVYYEAGFARGLGIDVIWMCRADHIKHVHFDTRQFNHIRWETPEDLKTKLRKRIDEAIGDGPLKGR